MRSLTRESAERFYDRSAACRFTTFPGWEYSRSPDRSTIHLDVNVRSVTQPPEGAARAEEREYIRLGLELLQPEEREIVIRRHFDSEEFAAIADAMQTTPEAARKRFGRALPKLFSLIKQLKNGQLEAALDEADEA